MPIRNSDIPDNAHLRAFLKKRAADLRRHADRLDALAEELPRMTPLAEEALYLEIRYKIFREE